MGTVAVIIPAFNAADYIREALESVLRQTRQPDEIIVVDDGSTDGTAEIAETFPGVTVIRQANRGVSAARNHAIGAAASEWIAFLDADDTWRADKLEKQMAALAATPGYDACTCNAVALRAGEDPDLPETPPLRLPPSDQIAQGLRGRLRVPPGTVVVRRDRVQGLGGFNEEAHFGEDWDMWLRLANAGCRFLLVAEDLLFIRMHGANASSQTFRMMAGELGVWDRNIGPVFHPAMRPLRRLQARSHFLGRAALVEREQKRPHLRVMAQSLVLCPIGDWNRYKVFAHMLLRQAGLLPAK